MPAILESIEAQSKWILAAFKSDNIELDFTIRSFIEIDKFLSLHVKNGQRMKGGRLEKNFGTIVFSIGSYMGETIRKSVPGSFWKVDDTDTQGEINAELVLPGGLTIWPIQRVMKRFKNGPEDSVYIYGHELTHEFTKEPFDQAYWEMNQENGSARAKPWWQFW